MYTLSATMEREGTVFELPIGNFPTIAEVAVWLEKYSTEMCVRGYNIKSTEG